MKIESLKQTITMTDCHSQSSCQKVESMTIEENFEMSSPAPDNKYSALRIFSLNLAWQDSKLFARTQDGAVFVQILGNIPRRAAPPLSRILKNQRGARRHCVNPSSSNDCSNCHLVKTQFKMKHFQARMFSQYCQFIILLMDCLDINLLLIKLVYQEIFYQGI